MIDRIKKAFIFAYRHPGVIFDAAGRGTTFAFGIVASLIVAAIVYGNLLFPSAKDVAYRALDPRDPACRPDSPIADIMSRREKAGTIGNDELRAIDTIGGDAGRRFTCAVQRHVIPDYRGGQAAPLTYDLAFLELQENGRSYRLRRNCDADATGCTGEPVPRTREGVERNQLRAILEHLGPTEADGPDARPRPSKRPHYVLAFVHGWRHNAEVGDSNVGDLRHYAGHVARFLEDRFHDDPESKPRVTAIYVGWRGARTDETWLKRSLGPYLRDVSEWIGALSAFPTLFDRKPVSEAIAPAALSALREIESQLKLTKAPDRSEDLPTANANRMIVFGHSLGGNMLITALHADLLKKAERQEAGRYMAPALGNLVVLINPAAEASKWTDIQRIIYEKTPMAASERLPVTEYMAGRNLFRREQRPILVSVTAALDWPAGGRGEADCITPKPSPTTPDERHDEARHDEAVILQEKRERERENRLNLKTGVAYDWATYDLFPAFKGDFRPLADTLIRLGSGRDPHDRCLRSTERTWKQRLFGWIAVGLGERLRVLPFMRTDLDQTRTIGHLDPMRPVSADPSSDRFSPRPFGTTHELVGRAHADANPKRKWCVLRGVEDADGAGRLSRKDCDAEAEQRREVPVDYDEIVQAEAGCAPATGWLSAARQRQREKHRDTNGQRWSSDEIPDAPALRFLHGFETAGLAATTRANDPFWNMRAFDTALARHDGFMLSSFICAMNQLVMDEITTFAPPLAAPPPPAPFRVVPAPSAVPEPAQAGAPAQEASTEAR